MTKTRKPYELHIEKFDPNHTTKNTDERGAWMPRSDRRRSFATLEAAERAAGSAAIKLAQEGRVDGWRITIRDGFNPAISIVYPVSADR